MPDRTLTAIGSAHTNNQDRYLIITADDFGAALNINEGIKIAADHNAITAISALTNFTESLPELKSISITHSQIGIGVHLNITTGKPILPAEQVPSLINKNGNFYTLEELLPVIRNISQDELRRELRAQIAALAHLNIKVDHLSDQNGILSLYSPFFNIILELADEFKVPVRSPEIASVKYPGLFPNSKMNKYGRKMAMRLAVKKPLKALSLIKYTRLPEIRKKVQLLDNKGIPHPDLLIDYFWGDPTAANLHYILEHLPVGTSELILHLGTGTRQKTYSSGLDKDYFINREKELLTITSGSLLEFYNNSGIRPIGYQDIVNRK